MRYESKTDQRGTQGSPVFIEAQVTTSKSKADKESDADEERAKADRERTAIKIAGFASGIAFAAAIIALVQLVMFRKQLDIMKDTVSDTQKAANAAQKTASATEKLAIEAADTARKELRAYVGFDATGFYWGESGDKKRFKVAFNNSGRTPAKSVKIVRCYDFEAPQDLEDYAGAAGPKTLIERYVIQPGQRSPMPLGVPHGFMQKFFVWGYVEYTDIYGDRWRFRFAYDHRGENEFWPYKEHNDEISAPEA